MAQSKFSTEGFEISNFLPQTFCFWPRQNQMLFPKHEKIGKQSFKSCSCKKFKKIQEVKFENLTHENLAFF